MPPDYGYPIQLPGPAFGDIQAGSQLAGGVAAALYRREKTGKGIVVDVALLNMAIWQLGMDLTATTITRSEPMSLAGQRVLPNPLIGPYRTADSRWLLLNMLDDTRHWAPTCRALGLDALIDDAKFVDTAARAKNSEELHKLIADVIGSTPLNELRDRLGSEDTIFAALASPVEVIDDPQVLANGYLAQHPNHPTCRVATAPMQFDDGMVEVRRGAPAIGEHTSEILDELGYSADEVSALRDAGAIA
jgi:crotonobetainyl-CoA:carnitine CoA-transferase CaiB-like acyl-CoA transferase